MGTQMAIQKILMTALENIWAACSNTERRREGDGMLSLGFFDAANNRQGNWLIRWEFTHFRVHCILSGRLSTYLGSCGAGRENEDWVQPYRSFSIFGDDGVVESLASTQGSI
jgi:hypothetical protein